MINLDHTFFPAIISRLYPHLSKPMILIKLFPVRYCPEKFEFLISFNELLWLEYMLAKKFGQFLSSFLPPEHLKKITSQCLWSQMKACNLLHQFWLHRFFINNKESLQSPVNKTRYCLLSKLSLTVSYHSSFEQKNSTNKILLGLWRWFGYY